MLGESFNKLDYECNEIIVSSLKEIDKSLDKVNLHMVVDATFFLQYEHYIMQEAW